MPLRRTRDARIWAFASFLSDLVIVQAESRGKGLVARFRILVSSLCKREVVGPVTRTTRVAIIVIKRLQLLIIATPVFIAFKLIKLGKSYKTMDWGLIC